MPPAHQQGALRVIKLTYVWPSGTRSEMWLSVEHILWMVQTPAKQTMIALVGDSQVTVAEHPHDIIRMIVNTEHVSDVDDDEDAYAQ